MKALHTLLILTIATTTLSAQDFPSTVEVKGEGIVNVVPDEVTVNVRVENTGKNAKDLKSQNDATINEVLKFLKQMNIADKDVKTEYMNLSKNYDYNSKTYHFSANQSISVKLRDLSKYESLMKGLMETGINRIDGVSFSSSQKEALESQARKKAVENAQKKAAEYAAALNQTIGKAVSISEFNRDTIGPRPMFKAMSMEASDSMDSQTIALGEMEIRVVVNVGFLLK